MSKPLCVVPVADLDSGEKHRVWDLPRAWLSAALAGTEATPRGEAGKLDVVLSLNGREVVVRGRVRAALYMPCARTLDPVEVDVDAEVFLLLEPRAAPAPRRGRAGRAPKAAAAGDRRRQRRADPEESELSQEDAARDTHDGETIVLDTFAREFLVLDLPMFPLRSDLRSEPSPTIPGAPGGDDPDADETQAIDPRLAPLADIARRLRDKE